MAASDALRSPRPREDRHPARRGRPVPMVVVLLAALLIALGLGVMGRATTAGAFRGSWELSRLGGPWLVAAFAAGALGGWRRGIHGLAVGAVAGAIAIGVGSLAYYGIWIAWGDDTVAGARRAAKLGIGWGAAGVAIGGAVGLLGALLPTRAGGRGRPWLHGAALGTLGGLLMGESIALLWVWDGVGLRAMATLEGIAGGALVVLGCLGRSWRFAVAALLAAGATATVAPVATTMVREALRQIGWAGA